MSAPPHLQVSQRAPDRAVGAVAADDVAEARLRDRSAVILQSHADTGIVLLQGGQAQAALDPQAAALQVAGQDTLGLGLRKSERRVGQVQGRTERVDRRLAVENRAQTREPETRVDHLAGKAHVLPDFEGARGDPDRAAIGRRLRRAVDDPAARPVPGEFAGECQADRSGPDDQNIRHRTLPGSTLKRHGSPSGPASSRSDSRGADYRGRSRNPMLGGPGAI
ncbi:hypothetical protein MRA01_00870 [Methylobacterium radiotolerans]|nr:hypothetical protein MRA01_00870 [Methylobacterium radiotolerans]